VTIITFSPGNISALRDRNQAFAGVPTQHPPPRLLNRSTNSLSENKNAAAHTHQLIYPALAIYTFPKRVNGVSAWSILSRISLIIHPAD
jgi:hypothetical protein